VRHLRSAPRLPNYEKQRFALYLYWNSTGKPLDRFIPLQATTVKAALAEAQGILKKLRIASVQCERTLKDKALTLRFNPN